MPLMLKRVLLDVGMSQAQLAAQVLSEGGRSVSAATISQIVNHDTWPRSIGRHSIESQIRKALIKRGLASQELKQLFIPAESVGAAESADFITAPTDDSPNAEESIHMLLRKQPLTNEARRHFKIARDPFTDEMQESGDVYLSDDIRYVRATMRQTAKHGGMLAIVGESGAGKTTIKHDLKDWIVANREPITVIEPYVLGLEDTEQRGKTLRAMDIAAAIIRGIDRTATPKRNAQSRSEQLHQLLRASAQAGRRHVLVIEEAHDLPVATLKHLKRFYELEPESGFGRLLAIILIGQTELGWKLDDRNPKVREVVQRCEVATLGPLDQEVHSYLKHKFSRIELDCDGIFDATAIQEVQGRLRVSSTEGRGTTRRVVSRSLCYPLAVNNLVSIALNQAARIGAPIITGELIAAAMRAQASEI